MAKPLFILLRKSLFAAAAVAFELVLEVVELGQECGEVGVVRIFLQGVVQEAHAENELAGVLFCEALFLFSEGCKGCKVMMSAEVEAHDVLDFAVDHFCNAEVVRTLFFVAIHSYFD